MDERKTILLHKLVIPSNKEGYALYDFTYQFLDAYPESKNKKYIELVRSEIKESLNEYSEIYNKRFAYFSNEILYKFWKMYVFEKDGTKKPIMYIYPYQLIKENHIMFLLSSNIKQYNRFMNNGIYETSFDIMEDKFFTNCDILLEETTKEEMMEHAKKSCDEAMEYRLSSLKNNSNVLD